MSPTEAASPPVGLGISLGGTQADVATHGPEGTVIFAGPARSHAVPPAIVLPGVRGETPLFSEDLPLPVVGAGLPWPTEADLGANGRAARLPVALAWQELVDSAEARWTWESRQADPPKSRSIEVADALGFAAMSVVAARAGQVGDRHACVAIPNDLDEAGQQALLESRALRGKQVALLWRPVAAAFEWCRQMSGLLPAASGQDEELGRLLCLHVGLDGIEITDLKLIRRAGTSNWVFPARQRPRLPRLRHVATLVEAACQCAMKGGDPEEGPADFWRGAWCAPALGLALASSEQPTEAMVLPLKPLGLGTDLPERLGNWIRESLRFLLGEAATDSTGRLDSLREQFVEWSDRTKETLAHGSRWRGAVVTGELAGVSLGNEVLGRSLVQRLATVVPNTVLIEGAAPLERGVVARGAATFIDRRSKGLPTYLDTLPRMESVVVQQGVPIWADLLTAEDEYVDGGRPWTRDPDFGPVEVAAGAETLDIDVWWESDQRIRHVSRALPICPGENVRAGLRVTMEPARGHARVELVPETAGVLGRTRVFLDWSTAKPLELTREEVLERIPRVFPPLELRQADRHIWHGSPDWQGALPHPNSPAALMSELVGVGLVRAERSGLAADLRSALRQNTAVGEQFRRSRPAEHHTAVDSHGELEPGSVGAESLTEFIELTEDLLARGAGIDPHVSACLGYSSADGRRLRRYLRDLADRRPHSWTREELILLGNSLRNERAIAVFAEGILARLEGRVGGAGNNDLRALARVLIYRQDALRHVDSEVCRHLFLKCHDRFRAQLQEGHLKYIARHAALGMAYLLRRRRYDNEFLPPASEAAVQAKRTLKQAISLYRSRRLRVIGGFVDTPRVMNTIHDYIDRRGVGRIMLVPD